MYYLCSALIVTLYLLITMKKIYIYILSFVAATAANAQSQRGCLEPSLNRGPSECVWPGEIDGDGQVTNFDILPIGLTLGVRGQARQDASTDWSGQPANDWLVIDRSFSAVNYKHIDADGNGTIEVADADAVGRNYGRNRSRTSDASINGQVPLFVESRHLVQGQRATLEVVLGDDVTPVRNAYGIAFTIEYDADKVTRGSVDLTFDEAWLGSDLLSFADIDEQNGRIEAAITRKDHRGQDGWGPLGTLNLTIRDDILRDETQHQMPVRITNVRLIDAQNQTIGTFRPDAMVTFGLASGVETVAADQNISIYPNPAREAVQIRSSSDLRALSLYNLQGQMLISAQNIENQVFTLNTQDLSTGVYFLRVQTAEGIYAQKLEIAK